MTIEDLFDNYEEDPRTGKIHEEDIPDGATIEDEWEELYGHSY